MKLLLLLPLLLGFIPSVNALPWSGDIVVKTDLDEKYVVKKTTVQVVDYSHNLLIKSLESQANKIKEKYRNINWDSISKKMVKPAWVFDARSIINVDLVRKAGIKWLALGIESGDKSIRLEVSKGKFEDVDVKKVISKVHDADINVMANYIYGLPGDTEETIKKTFELSLDLCTTGWNTYAAMALPGSQLYNCLLYTSPSPRDFG